MPNKKQLKDLEFINNQLKFYRSDHPKAFVFDLQGNTGGNTLFGEKILNSLFTPEYMETIRSNMNNSVYVDWRISKENIKHIQGIVKKLTSQNLAPKDISGFQNLINEMNHENLLGKKYYREYRQINSTRKKQCHIDSPLKNTPFIIIINKKCVSACLDFIDELIAATTNTILIGEETSSDSLYMDIREVQLPSKIASFIFPLKVYRNRIRGHNQTYRPNIPYPTDSNNSSNQQEWLNRTIKNIIK